MRDHLGIVVERAVEKHQGRIAQPRGQACVDGGTAGDVEERSATGGRGDLETDGVASKNSSLIRRTLGVSVFSSTSDGVVMMFPLSLKQWDSNSNEEARYPTSISGIS